MKEESERKKKFNFSLSYSVDCATKSVTIDDNIVSNINVFVYNTEGNLVDCDYSTTGNISLKVWANRQYNVYSIANIGNITTVPLNTEAAMLAYKYSISDYTGIAGAGNAVPMSGVLIGITLTDGGVIPIVLTRLISRVTVILDKSQLSGVTTFNIKNIRIKNTPRVIKPFGENTPIASEILADGDIATAAQIANITTSGVTFHLFENRQGTLLPENLLVTGKVFPDGSPYKEICSYIEMEIEYKTASSYANNLKYRFYLGGDYVSNFDVSRSTQYTVMVIPSNSGINETTWRVDVSNLKYYVTSISISPATHTLTSLGQTRQFTATVLPAYAENTSVTWSSSDEGVATVTAGGLVTAVANGTCNITATANDGSMVSGSATVVVNTYVSVSSISIDDNFELYVGQTRQIVPTVLPANATNPTVTYTSSNPIAATVSATGLVTAVAAGTTTITATADGKSATCVVTVKSPMFSINPTTATLYRGQTLQISHSATPPTTPSWSSTNATVASVSSTGLVTALTSGSATINAVANGITATCAVTVIPPKLTLDKTTMSMFNGEVATLSISTVEPSTSDITWAITTSTPYLTVTTNPGGQSATLTASTTVPYLASPNVSYLTATVTATANGVTATCTVNLYRLIIELGATPTVYEGMNSTIPYTIYPTHASGLGVTGSVVTNPANVSMSGNTVRGLLRHSGSDVSNVRVAITAHPTVNATCNVKCLPAVTLTAPEALNRMMNYTSFPEVIQTMPNSLQMTVTKAPNATIVWEIMEINKNGVAYPTLSTLNISQDGLVTLANTSACGKYRIRAKASTGNYYSENEVTLDVYYYLVCQAEIILIPSGSDYIMNLRSHLHNNCPGWAKTYMESVDNDLRVVIDKSKQGNLPYRRIIGEVFYSDPYYGSPTAVWTSEQALGHHFILYNEDAPIGFRYANSHFFNYPYGSNNLYYNFFIIKSDRFSNQP